MVILNVSNIYISIQDRITIDGVLAAPMFWSPEKCLQFLSDASDRIEQEQNDSKLLFHLDIVKELVGGSDWRLRLELGLQEDLRKFRTYTDDIKDLLRILLKIKILLHK